MEDRPRGWGRGALLVFGAAAVIVVYLGFRLFWFLTDDAFIAFRYVSNSLLGYGLVWNPPPFRPVEGYTSWLWVVLLEQVWRLFEISPPVAANCVSLGFGYATLFVCFKLVARMQLAPPLARLRFAFLVLIFVGIATNRTFLAWLSSGLETALFNFCFTLWIYFALAPRDAQGRGWVFGLSLSATLGALTRPDGFLMLVGSVVLFGMDLLERRRPLRALGFAFPLAGVLLHLLWRRWTYGEWLPNTYYAKYVAIWPESGWRYAASFALEYALWIWLALALVWALRRRELSRAGWIAVGVVGAHFAYYTLVIGGDHFEYRVYSHLVPLLFISLLWFAARLELRPAVAAALLGLSVVASWPLPWAHYLESRNLITRSETYYMIRPIAQRFPRPLGYYARAFDALQAWLIERSVCMRHQEHKIWYQTLDRFLPPREQGARIGWEDRPVQVSASVGVLGWRLPHVAVIDELGLNDYVIARTPAARSGRRQMAHDRRPPSGYLECFRPNVSVRPEPVLPDGVERFEVAERELTDADIVRCESLYRERLRGDAPPPGGAL